MTDAIAGTYSAKPCRQCSETKLLTDFYVCNDNKDGRHNTCKSCWSTRSAARYQKTRESVLASAAAYRKENRDALVAKDRAYYAKNKRKMLAAMAIRNSAPEGLAYRRELYRKSSEDAAWRTHRNKMSRQSQRRHPERHTARVMVNDALKNGKLHRCPCQTCGADKNVHGHHEDYSKPLEVVWLCRACHVAHHKARKVQREVTL